MKREQMPLQLTLLRECLTAKALEGLCFRMRLHVDDEVDLLLGLVGAQRASEGLLARVNSIMPDEVASAIAVEALMAHGTHQGLSAPPR